MGTTRERTLGTETDAKLSAENDGAAGTPTLPVSAPTGGKRSLCTSPARTRCTELVYALSGDLGDGASADGESDNAPSPRSTATSLSRSSSGGELLLFVNVRSKDCNVCGLARDRKQCGMSVMKQWSFNVRIGHFSSNRSTTDALHDVDFCRFRVINPHDGQYVSMQNANGASPWFQCRAQSWENTNALK